MIRLIAAATMLVAPLTLDIPPEGVIAPATATAPAVRIDPPDQASTPTTTEVPHFENDCVEMAYYRQAAGLPAHFDQIGYRESRCRNEDSVHTSCCYGWFQLNVSLHLRDHRLVGPYHACGVYSYADVNSDTQDDKQRQACAAKALYSVVGYSAWRTTS